MKDVQKLVCLLAVAVLFIALLTACGGLSDNGQDGHEDNPNQQPKGLKIGAIRDLAVARIEGEPNCLAVYSDRNSSRTNFTYRGKACSPEELFSLLLREWPLETD